MKQDIRKIYLYSLKKYENNENAENACLLDASSSISRLIQTVTIHIGYFQHARLKFFFFFIFCVPRMAEKFANNNKHSWLKLFK